MPRDDWKKLPRLYVRTDLAEGRRLTLPPTQAHYLTHVMRRVAGDRILLFNGSDGEWLGAVEAVRKNALDIICLEQTRTQKHEPDLLLLFAPVKRDHMEYLVQKSCELGVAGLQPVAAQLVAGHCSDQSRHQDRGTVTIRSAIYGTLGQCTV